MLIQAYSLLSGYGSINIGAGIGSNLALRMLTSTNPTVKRFILGLPQKERSELTKAAMSAASTTAAAGAKAAAVGSDEHILK
jgi:hypothetical protein